MKTKIIIVDKKETTIVLKQDDDENSYWLVGEINGDMNSYDSYNTAEYAFNSIIDQQTLFDEMGWDLE